MKFGTARHCPTKETVRQTSRGHADRCERPAGEALDRVRFQNYNQVMYKVNISDAKAHFSRHLERVESGETVLVCRRNVPIAEIRPVPKPPAHPRPVGIDRGMVVPPSFFEPLPDDLLDAFEGGKEPV